MGLLATTMRRQSLGAASDWTSEADATAARYGLDPSLLLAIMHVESSGDPAARGAAGEVGLMQVMPATAQQVRPGITPAELADPEINLDVGAAYLAAQLRRYGGDLWQAVSAYNAGTATPRNQSYVDRVRAALGLADEAAPTACCDASGAGGVVEWIQAHPYMTTAAALAALWWWRRR